MEHNVAMPNPEPTGIRMGTGPVPIPTDDGEEFRCTECGHEPPYRLRLIALVPPLYCALCGELAVMPKGENV